MLDQVLEIVQGLLIIGLLVCIVMAYATPGNDQWGDLGIGFAVAFAVLGLVTDL